MQDAQSDDESHNLALAALLLALACFIARCVEGIWNAAADRAEAARAAPLLEVAGNGSSGHLRCEAYFNAADGKSSITDSGKITGASNGNVTILFDDGVTQTVPESWVTRRASARVSDASGNDEAVKFARAARQAAEERARQAEADRREGEQRARQPAQHQSDHYELMGLKPGCLAEDVHNAYKKLVIIAHPDKNDKAGSTQAATSAWFRSVQQAYEVLKDPAKRQQYDISRGFEPSKPSAPGPGPAPRGSTKAFRKGDLVKINGLQQTPQYNNRQGEVVEDAAAEARVRVQLLFGGEVKQLDLRPENLTSV